MPLGVPLRTPAPERDRPLGSVPEATDQVYGPVPPAAVNCVLYGAAATPNGMAVVVIVSVESGAGTTLFDGDELGPVPTPFVAVTVNV